MVAGIRAVAAARSASGHPLSGWYRCCGGAFEGGCSGWWNLPGG